MACAGPRSALQAGLAAVVAGLVALTLLVSAAARHVDANRPPRTLPAGDSAAPDVRRPSPALLQFDYGSDEYDTTIQFPWADVGFNFAACSDLDATRPPDPVNSAIVWGRVAGLPSSRVCRSVSFHSAPGCAGPPMATYLRPATSAPTTMTFPASKMPASLRCGTGCGVDNVDCGSEAKCTISDKGQECVCAGALVFDATAKQCRAPPPSCATIVCPTNSTCNATADPPCICNAGFEMTNGQCVAPPPSCATIVCPTNSTCNATADPPCICNEGLTMTDGQCLAPPPSCATIVCPVNSTCNATADPPCICKKGLTMTDGQCVAVCKRACARNAECVLVGNKPACRCKAGYVRRRNKCIASTPSTGYYY